MFHASASCSLARALHDSALHCACLRQVPSQSVLVCNSGHIYSLNKAQISAQLTHFRSGCSMNPMSGSGSSKSSLSVSACDGTVGKGTCGCCGLILLVVHSTSCHALVSNTAKSSVGGSTLLCRHCGHQANVDASTGPFVICFCCHRDIIVSRFVRFQRFARKCLSGSVDALHVNVKQLICVRNTLCYMIKSLANLLSD